LFKKQVCRESTGDIDFHLLSIDNLTTVREQTVSTGHCLSWNRFFKPEICYGHTVLLCLLQQEIGLSLWYLQTLLVVKKPPRMVAL
jgi:hypothetical protein